MFSIPNFSVGFALGFGTGFVSRELVSAGKAVLRPVAKAAIKSGMQIIDRGRETFAYFGESMEDIVAEAKAEITSQPSMAAASGTTGSVSASEAKGPAIASASEKRNGKVKGRKEQGS